MGDVFSLFHCIWNLDLCGFLSCQAALSVGLLSVPYKQWWRQAEFGEWAFHNGQPHNTMSPGVIKLPFGTLFM
jgi:hypothetical protein